jgi:hypothetical protein
LSAALLFSDFISDGKWLFFGELISEPMSLPIRSKHLSEEELTYFKAASRVASFILRLFFPFFKASLPLLTTIFPLLSCFFFFSIIFPLFFVV